MSPTEQVPIEQPPIEQPPIEQPPTEQSPTEQNHAAASQQPPSEKQMTVDPAEAQEDPPETDSKFKEASERNTALLQAHGSTWDSLDDPKDPYNWPSWRKILIAVIVSFGQLITLMSTSMMASALSQIGRDVGANDTTTQITFSIFILGLAFAPFPIAALSEMYGRKSVWLVCNTWYMLWNAMCPVGMSLPMMVVGRFLAGSGASVGITLTGPIMADMYRKEHRGKSLAIATFVPYLGPALGPVIGGLISQKLAWSWLFWVLSIFDGLVTLIGLFLVRETYTPVLLRRKASSARGGTDTDLSPNPLNKALRQDFYRRLSTNLLRPLKLLVHRPIIQVIALTMALNFGVYCLLLSTFASLWITRYGQSEFIASLHYIAISVGTTIATQSGGPSMDYIFRKLKARSKDGATTTPEFRVPFIVPGLVLIPVGLFWYGWAAETQMHWALVDVGVAIFVCGSFVLSQGMLAYLLDEFHHAASANAAARVLSNVLGFAFPIFAPQMYSRLGYGWGNSVLGFIFIGLGWPVPLLLWRWGAKLRSLGREKTV